MKKIINLKREDSLKETTFEDAEKLKKDSQALRDLHAKNGSTQVEAT